jgi:DNA-binding response OmpR family regulator
MNSKILIIDDQIADTVALGLRQCDGADDLDFFTASDGGRGLTKAVELSPALILLDIDLPTIDGFGILSELQRRGVRTRVIMISGSRTDLTTAIECVKAGACDYVLKREMQPQLLMQRIRRALLLESTLNVRMAELPASSRTLIREAGLLKEHYERLKEEHDRLKRITEKLQRKVKDEQHHIVLATTQKVLAVTLAGGSLFLLKWLGVVQATVALPIVFLFLLVLLLIPADKIRGVSANVQKLFSANIDLDRQSRDRSGEEPDTGSDPDQSRNTAGRAPNDHSPLV